MEINLFNKRFSCEEFFKNDNFSLYLGRGGSGNDRKDYEDVVNILFKKYNIYLVVGETVLGEELYNKIENNPQEAQALLFPLIMDYFTKCPAGFEAWYDMQAKYHNENGCESFRKALKGLLDGDDVQENS